VRAGAANPIASCRVRSRNEPHVRAFGEGEKNA
jgi:hypothetical protein